MIVGLRFNPKDATKLIELVGRASRMELGPQAVSLFATAAKACENHEALELHCDNLDEARLIAHGFTQYGIDAPTLEENSLNAA